mmetsp:Transcript_39074/g.59561  ORF Transcript_39074/g.59561 Transcript_39074/m.59561 type:complete len:187 (-) Transcript_39074:1034-1594(-)
MKEECKEEQPTEKQVEEAHMDLMDSIVMDKKYKTEYFEVQSEFLSDLRNLSEQVKTVDISKRKEYLMPKLENINYWIEKSVRSKIGVSSQSIQIKKKNLTYKGSFRYNFYGIIVPLLGDGQDNEDPFIITRIIPELTHVFNTKMRAPFKVICEVIKYSEVKAREEGSYEETTASQDFGVIASPQAS